MAGAQYWGGVTLLFCAMKNQKTGKKVNKTWLHTHVNDPYVKAAHKDGYRARAAYKLQEIDEQWRLIRPGNVVVDLGSSPGAWSQYVCRRMKEDGAAPGKVFALDMLPMEPIAGVTFIQGDFREEDVLTRLHAALGGRAVDLVLSDMAPNLSGVAATDSARIVHLVELALDFALHQLKPEGALLAKVFHGGAYDPLARLFRAHFRQVKALKPKASRDKSAETFLLGMGIA